MLPCSALVKFYSNSVSTLIQLSSFQSTSMQLSSFHKHVNAIEQLLKHVNVIEQLSITITLPCATPKLYPNFLFWYSLYLHFSFYSFDYTVKSGGVCNRLPVSVPCQNSTLSHQRTTPSRLRITLF